MPNATVRANARTLPEGTNRRVVLGAVLATAAAGAAAADQRALLLWDRYNEQKGNCEQLESGPATQAQCQASYEALFAVEHLLQADIAVSLHALAAVLVIEIGDEDREDVPGLWRASLAAIRPELVGAIAEAADRVLAKDEPDPVLALVTKVRAAWDRYGEVDEEADEGDRLSNEANRVLHTAMDRLLETPPTTLAGAREALAWFVEFDRPNVPEKSGKYMRTLLRSPIFAEGERS
jgi:hypothetical protein